ncbi:hypothetical protein [Amnibacterium sp.]|uniref:hypothetical protein n=1 Tax=Amnibacterium sp. TaxID=1872496 RepID=UPI003F7C6401
MWVTGRDQLALEWFRIVRISNMQTLRWALGMINGWDRPVALRQAQRWVTRMTRVGYVDRTNLGGPGGSVVWATPAVTGSRRPNLFAQTTRHEIAVSAASTRYLAAGYSWARDERPRGVSGHVADGVAIAGDELTLIEVELTPKRADRYVTILARFRLRIEAGDADQVVYLCNPDSAHAVRAALRQSAAKRIADRVDVREVFDPRTAHWPDEELPTWLQRASQA